MKTFSFVIYYLICVAVLMTTFRIDDYLRNFHFPAATTIASYFLLALLLSVVAVYIAPWTISHMFPGLHRNPWADASVTAVLTFVIFCALGISFGPLGVDLPGTRIRGIFFAEWKFTNFIFYDGLLLSIVGGGLKRYTSIEESQIPGPQEHG